MEGLLSLRSASINRRIINTVWARKRDWLRHQQPQPQTKRLQSWRETTLSWGETTLARAKRPGAKRTCFQ